MSIYTTAIKYEPEWEAPKIDVLDDVAVNDTFEKKVEELHVGMKNMTMTGIYRERSGEQFTVSVQKFKIKNSGMNKKPSITPEQLARLFTYVAQQHCNKIKKGEMLYRCNFYGDNDELGSGFQKNKSFRLRPEVDDEEDDKSEDADADDDDTSSASFGEPIRMKGVVESELMQIIRLQTEQGNRLAKQGAKLQDDARALLQQARHDNTAALQAQDAAWSSIMTNVNTIVSQLGNEAKNSREETTRANLRLVKMSEDHAKVQQGEKNILQYAMDMFKEGMKSQWTALNRERSWERQIMYQQFEALAEEKKGDGPSGLIKDLSPVLLGIAGHVISKVGDKAQGEVLLEAAKAQMEDDDEEEEEDEDDDDEEEEVAKPTAPQRPRVGRPPVVDVEAQPSQAAAPADPAARAGAAKFFDENPLAAKFQLFGSMINKEESLLKKLKTIMGAKHYRTLQQATKSGDDVDARTLGTKLMGGVLMGGDMQKKVNKLLNEEQRELLTDITKELFGGGGGFPKAELAQTSGGEEEKDAS